jgi:hypothetical protein
MRALSNTEILALWENGSRRHPLDRALLILSVAFPDQPYDRLADWALGRRNRALAELRSSYFGPDIRGWVACGKCGEKLEFEMDTRVISDGDPENEELDGAGPPVVVDGKAFRLPSSRDLALVANETDPRRAAVRIAESCHVGNDDSSNFTDEDIEKIGDAMALADPLAETTLALRCANCESQWQEPLDLVSFLWAEIESRARRLLFEVHSLASAYGWSEAEILSLTEMRRFHYFEMVQH